MEAALRGPQGRRALEQTTLTIGSSPDNQLVLNDPKVSAHHAEIQPEGQGFSITDLGSIHGTYVNSQRLDWNSPHLLTPGATIALGDTAFTYEEGDVAPLASPPVGVESASGMSDWPGATPAGDALTMPDEYDYPASPPASSGPLNEQQPQSAGARTFADNPAYASPQNYQQFPAPPYQQFPQQTGPGSSGYPGTYPGYPASYPGNVPPARRRGRRWLWVALACVLIIGIAGGVALFYFTRATPDKAIDAYCNALQGQDYHSAYNLLAPSLQSIETEAEFAGTQQAIGRVTVCTHDSANVTGNEATSNLTLMSGGQNYVGIISLAQGNDGWKISVLISSPQLTLTTFCNALRIADYHTAYIQLSSGLRHANTETSFVQGFKGLNCTFNSVVVSGNASTSGIVFSNPTGQTLSDVVGLIQDPSSNSVWKIDAFQTA